MAVSVYDWDGMGFRDSWLFRPATDCGLRAAVSLDFVSLKAVIFGLWRDWLRWRKIFKDCVRRNI